jgi:SAM-dependent methyltransferase
MTRDAVKEDAGMAGSGTTGTGTTGTGGATVDEVREQVRTRYAGAATAAPATGDACCGDSCCGGSAAETDIAFGESAGGTEVFGADLYGADERGELPEAAVLASLGCGNPIAVAELAEGETVLDLGSGGGIDVFLSARRVGPTGFAYGLDMTTEMLELARRNQAEAGLTNVEFLEGYIEDIPLTDAAVDVVISNCVVNLSPDKPAVFAEMHRILRPGGRIGITDVVADDRLTSVERRERGDWSGCIAGALSFEEYRAGLVAAGFGEVEISPTHQVADGMHSAIVRAVRP